MVVVSTLFQPVIAGAPKAVRCNYRLECRGYSKILRSVRLKQQSEIPLKPRFILLVLFLLGASCERVNQYDGLGGLCRPDFQRSRGRHCCVVWWLCFVIHSPKRESEINYLAT